MGEWAPLARRTSHLSQRRLNSGLRFRLGWRLGPIEILSVAAYRTQAKQTDSVSSRCASPSMLIDATIDLIVVRAGAQKSIRKGQHAESAKVAPKLHKGNPSNLTWISFSPHSRLFLSQVDSDSPQSVITLIRNLSE